VARYSNEFKARAVARLVPPESAEITGLSQEIGVSVATLERWLADARLEAVIATAAMDEAQRSAWCREQGPGIIDCQYDFAVRLLPANARPQGRGLKTSLTQNRQSFSEIRASKKGGLQWRCTLMAFVCWLGFRSPQQNLSYDR
jgi:hypothetical protein